MATVNWLNSAGGDFGVAANWSTDSVPFLNDDLTVSAFGQYLVTISDNDQANSLTFNAPQAALQENAGSLTWTGTLLVNSGFLSLNESEPDRRSPGNGRRARLRQHWRFGRRCSLNAGRRIARDHQRNPQQCAQLFPAGSSTIAAAHGTTLNETASNIDI